MKISEVINSLQKWKNTIGDAEVMIVINDNGSTAATFDYHFEHGRNPYGDEILVINGRN